MTAASARHAMHLIKPGTEQPPPAPEPPGALLVRWRLLERSGAERGPVRIIVGVVAERPGEVLVTKPIVTWDWQLECAVTEDGSIYFLSPGRRPEDANGEFASAATLVTATDGCVDVTDRVLASDGAWPAGRA